MSDDRAHLFRETYEVPPLKGVGTIASVVAALPPPWEHIERNPRDDNIARASAAAAAVLAYGEATGTARHEEVRLVIQDLLGDLRHLVDAVRSLAGEYPTTFEELAEGGRLNYIDEVRGQTS